MAGGRRVVDLPYLAPGKLTCDAGYDVGTFEAAAYAPLDSMLGACKLTRAWV